MNINSSKLVHTKDITIQMYVTSNPAFKYILLHYNLKHLNKDYKYIISVYRTTLSHKTEMKNH